MVHLETTRSLSPADLATVRAAAVLNDHLQADLDHGPRPGFLAVLARDTAGAPVGYAQASTGNQGFVVGSTVWAGRSADTEATRGALLRRLIDSLPADSGVTWWTDAAAHAGPLAASLGLTAGRTLLQLRRALPLSPALAAAGDIDLRPFRVGADEAAWLEVNNAAFAWHAEQGGWDMELLRQREREPWFRSEGFLIHERDHRLAGFCWTKLHPGDNVGEIYVIAVHPDFHGLGLGKALTVAGLVHLHRAGAVEGMLYVDADNTSAVALYRALGFDTTRADQAYVRIPKGTEQ
jgi:mycothiol synthase